MSHTITAIFRTADIAQTVSRDIAATGVSERHISVVGGSDRADDIDTLYLPRDEANVYRHAVQEGNYVVSAEVEDEQLDTVADIMRHPEHGVDIDAYEADYRDSPAYAGAGDAGTSYTGASATGASATGTSATGTSATGTSAVEGEQTIQLAEERLTVGKRAVERGSAHIRTYVQEVPVEERVRLREERASVERRPVDKVVSGADADALFTERDIEVTTSSEEAVVDKEAVVTEEVVVGKEVTEREEVVQDTVRKTDVDVDRDRT